MAGVVIEVLEGRRLLSGPIAIPPMVPDDQSELPVTRLNGNPGAFAGANLIGSSTTPRLSVTFSRGAYQLIGSGTGIGGSSDNVTFASRPAAGDGSIIVRVTGLQNSGTAPRAGIMIRSSMSASAPFVSILITPSNGLIFSRRLTDAGSPSQSFLPGVTLPRFLKLTREGNTVSTFYAADGVTWTQLGTAVTLPLGTDPQVGLVATASSSASTTTATFTHVSVLLPLGSDAADLGGSSVGSYATYSTSSNAWSIASAAVDAAGRGDEVGFTHRAMLGQGSLIANIGSFGTSPSSSAAGLMLRSALTSGAPQASVMVTKAGVVQFRWRSLSGGSISSADLNAGTSALSLKLERNDNSVSAYYSLDRVNWIQVGAAQSIAFASSRAFGGLAIRSGTIGELATVAIAGFTQAGTDDAVSANMGSGSATGSGIFDSTRNTHYLQGRGAGLGTADSFTFIGKTMGSDGEFASYLSGFAPGNASARAGLMVRADTTTTAPFAAIFLASTGLIVQWRAGAGGAVSSTFLNGVSGNVSLKLIRTGNSVSARYSIDGLGWNNIGGSMLVLLGSAPVAGMAVASGSASTLSSASFTGFDVAQKLGSGAGLMSAADELFLNDLQARSVSFFHSETNASTGLVPDGSLANGGSNGSSSSIASVGFGLSALALADDRGFLTHSEAYNRALTTVNFLYNNGAQVNGFFYHFLNASTGARVGTSELSPMDTALLMAGVLHVAEHWGGTPLATTAKSLFDRVNWPWMLKPNGQFYGHWTPENGFEYGYGDFSEAVLLYLLGLGSSTHPTPLSSWNSWLRSPVITYSGSTFITAQTRALFTVQYPLGWFDLRGKTDAFGLNYVDNASKATLAQRTLAINLNPTYPQYGGNVWGLTAADGPTGYTVWGGPPATSNVDGSVVPTAPGGSLAFTPRRSLDALRNMQTTYPSTYRKYGFVDAFNPHTNWTSTIVLGIDVGMMMLAAENARSGDIWEDFMQSPVAQTAVTRAFGSARSAADVGGMQDATLVNASPATLRRKSLRESLELEEFASAFGSAN